MIYGLYHSAAGMLTTEYRQNVLANNLANADTVGFKRDVPTFAERVPAVEGGRRGGPSAADLAGLSGGLWLGRTYTDFSEGQYQQTGSPTDVALQGPGFLAVQLPTGPLYTRDGRLMLLPDGTLAAAVDGAPVLGIGDLPIRLDPRGGPLTIDDSGRVRQDGVTRGQLALVDFTNGAGLRKVGTNRFAAPAAGAVASPALVRSGYIENAGVQPVAELVDMLQATQSYQLNARMVALQDESLGRLIGATLRA
ncbi:MAG: flagellar hook-basal body protein [Planctomycetota bacterium]